jgi:hypothetical protein
MDKLRAYTVYLIVWRSKCLPLPLLRPLDASSDLVPTHPILNSPSTPNTRKRQRIDYLPLHNGPPRGAPPTTTSPQQITAPSAPVARMLPPSWPRIPQPQLSADTVENNIDTYLDTPCVKYFGPKTIDQSQWVLDWWNANKSQYICMACVAREFLAIPASEVDCERLFNEGRDLLGIRRYSISGNTMSTMMLLKSRKDQWNLLKQGNKLGML